MNGNKVITHFWIKVDVLVEMFESPEWTTRLHRANTVEEASQVVTAYCKSIGRKVKEIDLPPIKK